jgi:hypothetical protein
MNAYFILSENGWHPVCGLSQKKAVDCMIGEKNHYVGLERRGEDG